jgi:hypothetical protein
MRNSLLLSTPKKNKVMQPTACPLSSFISLQPSIGNSISSVPFASVVQTWIPTTGLDERRHGHHYEAK